MTPEELKILLREVLDEHTDLERATHAEHHNWIAERIDAEKARKELMLAAAKAFAQWSVVGIAAGVWAYLKGNVSWPH